MEYLLLVYQEQGTPTPQDVVLAEVCREHERAWRERGTLVLAATLQNSPPAAPLTLHNGTLAVNENAPSLTGVYLIYANDINDAIRAAATMPQARFGTIEIRAVTDIL